MVGSNVTAECKMCGGTAAADSFKLHYKFRQMVCPRCYTGKTEELKAGKQPIKNAEPLKPAGWDKDDEYLEKAARVKKEQDVSQFTKVAGSDLLMCRCSKCKYSFKYDALRKVPRTCPYCDADIPRVKMFSSV